MPAPAAGVRWEGNLEKLEEIASRVAHAVGSEESPDRIMESASLVTELAREFEAQNSDAAPEVRGAPGTVVLAASDAAERRSIRALLDRYDCAVLEVRTGAEALAICAADPAPIDLLVTGLSLADMSGAELVAHVAMVRPSLAVLSVSEDAGEALARSLAEALSIEVAG